MLCRGEFVVRTYSLIADHFPTSLLLPRSRLFWRLQRDRANWQSTGQEPREEMISGVHTDGFDFHWYRHQQHGISSFVSFSRNVWNLTNGEAKSQLNVMFLAGDVHNFFLLHNAYSQFCQSNQIKTIDIVRISGYRHSNTESRPAESHLTR